MVYLKVEDLQFQDSIEKLYFSLHQLPQLDEVLIVDLSSTSWLFPHSVLSIVTAARLWHSWTGQHVIIINLQDKLQGYLERVNLYSECNIFLRKQKPARSYYDRSPSSQRLLEIASIPSNEQSNIVVLRTILRQTKSILKTWLTDSRLVDSVLTMVSEITQNVVHSKDTGYIMVQRFEHRHLNELSTDSEIHLAIGDIGIGIRNSLLQQDSTLQSYFSKGSEFIQHALIQGISGQPGNRGIGLDRVRELVDYWQGALVIRSESSQIRVSGGFTEVWDGLVDVPGVQVFIIVRGTKG